MIFLYCLLAFLLGLELAILTFHPRWRGAYYGLLDAVEECTCTYCAAHWRITVEAVEAELHRPDSQWRSILFRLLTFPIDEL